MAVSVVLLPPWEAPALASEPQQQAEAPAVPAQARVGVTVSLKGAPDLAGLGPSPTLFLTARPANSRAAFASRQEVLQPSTAASFPRDVVLGASPSDLLLPPEQYTELAQVLEGQDVVVSARLDKDGDPRTRDAEDLVGRGVASWRPAEGGRAAAEVQLEGRGLFGRLVTSRT